MEFVLINWMEGGWKEGVGVRFKHLGNYDF